MEIEPNVTKLLPYMAIVKECGLIITQYNDYDI